MDQNDAPATALTRYQLPVIPDDTLSRPSGAPKTLLGPLGPPIRIRFHAAFPCMKRS